MLERKQQLGLLRAIGFETVSAVVTGHAGERLAVADRFGGRDWIGVVDHGAALADRSGVGSLAGVDRNLYQHCGRWFGCGLVGLAEYFARAVVGVVTGLAGRVGQNRLGKIASL